MWVADILVAHIYTWFYNNCKILARSETMSKFSGWFWQLPSSNSVQYKSLLPLFHTHRLPFPDAPSLPSLRRLPPHSSSCIPLWHRCLLSKRYGKGFIVLPLWILNYSNTLALSQWQKICFQDCLFRDSTHLSILGSFLTTTDSFGRGLIISYFRNKKIANMLIRMLIFTTNWKKFYPHSFQARLWRRPRPNS